MNDLKQGDTLSPLFFNFALKDAIRRVKVNKDGLKLKGTYQLLVYGNDINILVGSVHAIKKSAYALILVFQKTEIEINADKPQYLVISGDQNAGRSQGMKIINSSNV
jgi:hypothetical protein